MHRLRRHLTYANVAATLAILLAIAGGTTAIAAKVTARKNSVTSKSIRNGNVTAKDLTSVVRVDAPGVVTDPNPSDEDFTTAGAQASCPTDTRPVGGGTSAGTNRVFVTTSVMSRNGWAGAVSSNASGPQPFTVTAWCLVQKPGVPISK